jgi:hypothetical protein
VLLLVSERACLSAAAGLGERDLQSHLLTRAGMLVAVDLAGIARGVTRLYGEKLGWPRSVIGQTPSEHWGMRACSGTRRSAHSRQLASALRSEPIHRRGQPGLTRVSLPESAAA